MSITARPLCKAYQVFQDGRRLILKVLTGYEILKIRIWNGHPNSKTQYYMLSLKLGVRSRLSSRHTNFDR